MTDFVVYQIPKGESGKMAIKNIASLDRVFIKQKKELAELFGFETRNKYSIETLDGVQLAYAAEQQKGAWAFIARQFFGHWRTFDLMLFDADREVILRAQHPFRFFFQRLEIYTPDGRLLGTVQRRFSLVTKSFDLAGPNGEVLFSVRSPIWKIWTFPFVRMGKELAWVRKKWGGLVKEAFTDADTFEVEFGDSHLSDEERVLIVTAGLYIDLMFFERKAGSN
ncbi:MAG: hypothetical protein KDD53_02105 [Bdellovibrionales bacterium]|nr:hypothetical protein [Bdellovibrionales bacterium]